jgi:hypothetical protein
LDADHPENGVLIPRRNTSIASHNRAGAQLRGGPICLPKADDQGGPHASIDEARAWSKAETARWKKLTEDVQIEHPQ